MESNQGISTPLVAGIIAIIILVGGIFFWQYWEAPKGKITLITDQEKYEQEETVRITITNNFGQDVDGTLRIENFDKQRQQWKKYEVGKFQVVEGSKKFLEISGPIINLKKLPQNSDLTLKWIPVTKEYMFEGEPEKYTKRIAGPGKYRVAVTLHDEKEISFYSDKFIIIEKTTSPLTQDVECEVERGSDIKARSKFHKVLYTKISWDNYNDFSVEKATLSYGYGPTPIFEEKKGLTKKMISRDEKTLVAFQTSDPRIHLVYCEPGSDCPPPQFIREGKKSISNSLAFYFVPNSGSREFIEANDIRFIEWYERNELPEWASSTKKEFSDFKPGELLLRLDLSNCIKRFCERVALEGDPSCVEEYHSPTSKIKGTITDHQGNPVEGVTLEFIGEGTTQDCTGSEYTNENGEFIIDECTQPYKLLPATYNLRILPPMESNLDQEFKKVSLQQGEEKSLDINLEQCGSIAGKVTGSEGNPLTGWVYKIGAEQPRYTICDRSECEPGTFKIPYLEPGTYQIGATVEIEGKQIKASPKEVKVNLGESSTVNFVVER